MLGFRRTQQQQDALWASEAFTAIRMSRLTPLTSLLSHRIGDRDRDPETFTAMKRSRLTPLTSLLSHRIGDRDPETSCAVCGLNS